MFEDNEKPFLRLRKEHQKFADELDMTTAEYLDYRMEIERAEEKRLIQETPPVVLTLTSYIDLAQNADNLGYSKSFFTDDDAGFLFDQITKCEKENSYVESIDYDECKERDRNIRSFMATGVKYDFKHIGLTLYSVFGFDQFNYSNNDKYLDYGHTVYLYHHRSNVFEDVIRDDHVLISFLNA